MGISINVGEATIIQLVQAKYEHVLNGVGTYEVSVDGAGAAIISQATTGATVQIYLDGTLDFEGYVEQTTRLANGGLSVQGTSTLQDFIDEECPVDTGKRTKTYLSTNDNTIFSALVGEVTGWTANVTGSTASSVDSFRVSNSMNIWQGLIQLIRQTGKDVRADYSTNTLYLENKKGSANAFAFLDGRDITSVEERKRRAKASKVIVYGKGDGRQQIIGSAGTGTPVRKVIDRNIISVTAANQRATSELALIDSEVKNYRFEVTKPNLAVSTGDQGTITASGYGLTNQAIDIVRVTRMLNNRGQEKLQLEVTNPEYRIASRNLQEIQAETAATAATSESSMLGSGNLQTFSAAMNAKLGAPLRRIFYLSADDIQDEAGNLRVDRMDLDWDIDPYRSEFGTVSETNEAPSLAAGSADSHKHDPSDSGHVHSISTTTTDNSDILNFEGSNGSNFNISIGTAYSTIASVSMSAGTYAYIIAEVDFDLDTAGGYNMFWVITVNGSTLVEDMMTFMPSNEPIRKAYVIPVNQSYGSSFSVNLAMKSSSSVQADLFNFRVHSQDGLHSHSITALTGTQTGTAAVDDSNRNPGLAGNAASHNHGATIGDDVDDSASVNAANTNIYLDYYNTGTGAWVNKRTWSAQALLQEDFDLTDSGTYPDAVGYWRTRVEPTSANPDFAQCIVRVKHSLDN